MSWGFSLWSVCWWVCSPGCWRPLSVSSAYALSSVVGEAIVQIPLEFTYSVSGALLWLLIVVALSALRATKVSVRESLAYE